ncbi:hypothetical protein D043_1439A, partial [Vibrio parahaemolyticus EKP-021]
MNIHLRPELI